ncbi:response regulator [Thermodesulfobacteriota bacterium]
MNQKVAFIDDENSVLQSLKWIFKDEPYQLFAFQSPVEALQKIGDDKFAVVVTDQVMPEMDGTTFLHRVMEKHPDTVRIIMTGHSVDAVKKEDIYNVITKPWDIDEMKKIIKNAVASYEEKCQESRTAPDNLHRILYVDNDHALVQVTKQVLERLGYEVVITTRGTEAVRLMQSRPERFDLVITDMNMSHMTGLDLSKALLSIRGDIPIILCTGFSGPDTEEKAKEAGIRGVILKPFLMQDLARIVREAIEERNY